LHLYFKSIDATKLVRDGAGIPLAPNLPFVLPHLPNAKTEAPIYFKATT
jgi:hypothetical protein